MEDLFTYTNNIFSTNPKSENLFDLDDFQTILSALISTGHIIIKATAEEIIYGTINGATNDVISIYPNGEEVSQLTGEVINERRS